MPKLEKRLSPRLALMCNALICHGVYSIRVYMFRDHSMYLICWNDITDAPIAELLITRAGSVRTSQTLPTTSSATRVVEWATSLRIVSWNDQVFQSSFGAPLKMGGTRGVVSIGVNLTFKVIFTTLHYNLTMSKRPHFFGLRFLLFHLRHQCLCCTFQAKQGSATY